MTVRAAKRDASWYDKPGQSWRWHIVLREQYAACSPPHPERNHWPRMVLAIDGSGGGTRPAAEVPDISRCRRPGCRQRWPS